MAEFSGKVVLVTGAARGTGRALALAFASLGANVAANDINPLGLDETVRLVQQAGGIARSYIFDVAKRMPIEAMLAQVHDEFDRLDVLVNHAAVRPDAALLDMDEWEFHRTLDVNLGGPFFTMQLAGRAMRAQGEGVMINLVSFPGAREYKKGHTALSASLAGLLGLTQSASTELASYRVRVNAVCSGLPSAGIRLAEPAPPGLQDWAAALPQPFSADRPDLVYLVLYLCSQAAQGLTGHLYSVAERGTV